MPDSAAEPRLVTLADIREAADRLDGVIQRTPLLPLLGSGPNRWLKAENLQPTGAFKLRGAYNALAQLSLEQRRRGVVTHSSGNHGYAVAYAARLLGCPVVVVVPGNAVQLKLDNIASQGAEIVSVGPSNAERTQRAHELAESRGLELIPSFNDARVIAGQGTAGLEIVEQLGQAAVPGLTVLVPVGGGGLASGVAAAVKALVRDARVIGVEPELAADARDSLAAGRIVAWPAEDVGRTMADGLQTESVGELTFAHLRRWVDEMVTVDEDEIGEAMVVAAQQARLVLEPSGAVALAAVRRLADSHEGPLVALASGGNVGIERYGEILHRYHRP